jgi:hypothetical protein
MRRALLMLVMLSSALPLFADDAIFSVYRFRMHAGHDPAWRTPAFDDRGWPLVNIRDVPEMNDTIWLRRSVNLRNPRQPGHPAGIGISGMASHEIWWDGEKIGTGGVVARTAAGERPGPVDALYQIPDRLAAPGRHTLAIRLSAFHRHFTPRSGIWGVFLGDYSAIETTMSEQVRLALAALSGILLTAAFAFAMFLFNGRDRRSLLLGTLCVSAAVLLLAESWRTLVGYTYDFHIVRLLVVTTFTWLVAVQLVVLVVGRFPHRRGRQAVIGTASVATLCWLLPMWDLKALAMFVAGVFVTLGWTIAAVRRRMPGSGFALVGVGAVAAGLVLQPLRFAESGLFLLLNVLFVCLLCSHAIDVRRALLRSARLELEVLKRQLQPHFLMNTLTALSEWIETNPQTAVRMIDALAEEMRILTDVAGERLIPAGEELRLCRAHLAMMEMRKDVRYELIARGFAGDERVPPGTFHTLVENAVTHGARAAHVALELTASREGSHVRYRFQSPVAEVDEAVEPGTGTRYIEARLAEAWGTRWSFVQQRDGASWQAEIVVPA